jgi:hypothetical protein
MNWHYCKNYQIRIGMQLEPPDIRTEIIILLRGSITSRTLRHSWFFVYWASEFGNYLVTVISVCRRLFLAWVQNKQTNKQTNSVALSPRANYID